MIYLFTYVQFFSDSDRYPLRGKDECTLKKNYARTNTFKFSIFSRIVDMWNTLPLPIRQATNIASFKKGVREFLDGNVWGFLIILILILLIVLCTYLRIRFYIFNCLSFKLSFYYMNILQKMVCLLWGLWLFYRPSLRQCLSFYHLPETFSIN